jgi:hypothetical protein
MEGEITERRIKEINLKNSKGKKEIISLVI